MLHLLLAPEPPHGDSLRGGAALPPRSPCALLFAALLLPAPALAGPAATVKEHIEAGEVDEACRALADWNGGETALTRRQIRVVQQGLFGDVPPVLTVTLAPRDRETGEVFAKVELELATGIPAPNAVDTTVEQWTTCQDCRRPAPQSRSRSKPQQCTDGSSSAAGEVLDTLFCSHHTAWDTVDTLNMGEQSLSEGLDKAARALGAPPLQPVTEGDAGPPDESMLPDLSFMDAPSPSPSESSEESKPAPRSASGEGAPYRVQCEPGRCEGVIVLQKTLKVTGAPSKGCVRAALYWGPDDARVSLRGTVCHSGHSGDFRERSAALEEGVVFKPDMMFWSVGKAPGSY